MIVWSFIALVAMSWQSPQPMSLRRVLEMHQHYLDRIQSLDATMESYESRDGGSSWTLSSRERWWKDGPRERYTSSSNGFYDLSGTFRQSDIHLEYSYSPDETRYMNGWNREKAPSSLPSPANHYHMAAATIGGPATSGSLSGRPPYLMMLAATLEEYLPDAVRHASSSSLTQTADGMWEVALDTTLGVPATMRVTLDPRRGFAIARREVASRGPEPQRGLMEVTEYQEVAPSLFIPTRIQIRTPDRPGHLREVRVTRLRVNEPLSPDFLTLQFPEGMKVQDTRSGVWHIWGPHGPKQTFASKEELDRYERGFGFRGSSSLPLWIYAGASLTLAAVLWWLMRVRRRLADRGHAA